MTARTRRGEDGFAGGFEGMLFGLLIFVAGTLLVAYAWGVVDTKTATGEAARQAARTYVEAPDAAAAAQEAGLAADAALAGYGRDPSRARVVVATAAGGFTRCDRITISVSYPAPLVDLPFIGSMGRAQPVTSRHSEIVDPFRSGVPGVATCG